VKGILRMHLVLACASSALIWIILWLHSRTRRSNKALPVYRLPLEFAGVIVIALTGHLGGFLSGVNGTG